MSEHVVIQDPLVQAMKGKSHDKANAALAKRIQEKEAELKAMRAEEGDPFGLGTTGADPEVKKVMAEAALGGALINNIGTLAASLGVAPAVDGSYEPDAFVRAIRRRHDELVEITAKLSKQNQEQRLKAIELAQRERAVLQREQRIDAAEQLVTPKGKGSPMGWWRL